MALTALNLTFSYGSPGSRRARNGAGSGIETGARRDGKLCESNRVIPASDPESIAIPGIPDQVRHGGIVFTQPDGSLASLPDAPLFSDFSAEFPRGAVTAVTGPNGSGKTTLARLLVGILKPHSGDVYIDDDPVRDMTLTEVGGAVGYVMQDPSRQIFKTSVADEMMFGLRNKGTDANDAEKLADEYLELFGLSDRKEDFPFAMSTGERQRLVLAAVLAMKPSYLILDEPTASLDPGRRRVLGRYLSDIVAKDGVGVVLISHDKKFVVDYADSSITLAHVADETAEQKETRQMNRPLLSGAEQEETRQMNRPLLSEAEQKETGQMNRPLLSGGGTKRNRTDEPSPFVPSPPDSDAGGER